MNGLPVERIPRTLELYLQISQYPILAQSIRERMREELFSRGVIDREQFEREAEEKAVATAEVEVSEEAVAAEAEEAEEGSQ